MRVIRFPDGVLAYHENPSWEVRSRVIRVSERWTDGEVKPEPVQDSAKHTAGAIERVEPASGAECHEFRRAISSRDLRDDRQHLRRVSAEYPGRGGQDPPVS